MSRFVSLYFASILFALTGASWAAPANVWHIPDNLEIDNGATHMRDPWIEMSNDPAHPTTIKVYQGIYKGNGANQTGGTLFYKGASQNVWSTTALAFYSNVNSNQYWKATFSTGGIPANDVIQYYIFVATDNSGGFGSTFIYAPSGYGDHGGQTIEGAVFSGSPQQNQAASSPFTIRNRPGWIFHANNRVNSGNDVQFWAKIGYIGDSTNLATRWVSNGALYYTTDGTDPVAGSTPGTAGNGSTQVATFGYDHPENSNQNGGSQSIAGTAMWWVATASNLLGTPLGTTIKYKVGFWNSANNEQKFGDYNAGDGTNYQGHIFSFANGTIGDPVLTVNGINANYTTEHVFVNETTGDSVPFVISFSPGQANVTAAEVFTNLNRRDKATTTYTDGNGIVTEEGIEPYNGDLIATGDDSHYYKAYTMNNGGAGTYTLTLNATRTGAYRLTARWKVQGDNNWRYYTNISAGRRDHAIVVSPVDVLKINLYEVNVFNLDASGASFAQRGTLEDLFDAPNAPHQGTANHWNLSYVQNLGCNWLWFQPIHPITEEAQQGHDPGSPYSVRNFFEINPLLSTSYNASSGINDPGNRAAALGAFQGLVSAANNAGVGIMLDAPFNHTAPDCEISTQGDALFGNNPLPTALFRDVEARFYSRDGNYAMRASGANNIAIAPDRGDFGKWGDVRDVYFGRYAALVDVNPAGNGNYNNEQDWFDYSIGNEAASGSGNGHFDQVTQNVWRYFSNYTLYWLTQTGVPPGSNLATQTSRGIGGLRADFGQGLPPQLWEYIINKTRTRKWNFVFMAESLDGGAVTYRSNRHFDIENENIVFPLKSAGNAADYRNIFEGRRSAYGNALVLLNNMSHDEEAFADPWQAVVRYAVCGSVDGVPLIFPGQELGISTTFGYSLYEVNFGKNIADFKDYNSLQPAWNDSNYGNDQLYPVYQGIGQARLFSPALRSQNRYFLNEDGNNQTIYAVAKYEAKNASPATSDVVFAFANTDRNSTPSGNFHVNQDSDSNGVNDYGIKPGRTYNVRNIAAYTNIDPARRTYLLWGPNGRSGSDIINNGIFVGMNKVPTTDGDWGNAPYEAQYLKLYDVTQPSTSSGSATTANAYSYAVGTTGNISWAAAPADSEGVTPCYRVSVDINGNITSFVTCGTSATINGSPGQTASVIIRAVNPNDNSMSGPPSTATNIKFIDPNADDDGDGMTNSAEDAAGTNPFDPNSGLKTTGLSAQNGNTLTLQWSSVAGKKYQVQGAASVAGPWNPAGPVLNGTGGTLSPSVTASDPSFFRVVLVP